MMLTSKKRVLDFFNTKYSTSKKISTHSTDPNDKAGLDSSTSLNGKIMFTRERDCTKTMELVSNLVKQYSKQDGRDLRTRVGGVEGAYRKHLQDILTNHSFKGDGTPEYEIAIRLMYNGYTKNEVCLAVYKCAPSHCELPRWKKSWGEYAEHVTSYAFSASGQQAISRNKENLAHWRKVEGREPDNTQSYPEQRTVQKMNQHVRHPQ